MTFTWTRAQKLQPKYTGDRTISYT